MFIYFFARVKGIRSVYLCLRQFLVYFQFIICAEVLNKLFFSRNSNDTFRRTTWDLGFLKCI